MFRKNVSVRKTFSLFAVLCLVMGALSLVGCSEPDPAEYFDRQFVPVGEWSDGFGGEYKIKRFENTVEYNMAAWGSPGDGDYYPAINFTGNIEAAIDFSGTSGVLIVKVIAASPDEPGYFIDNYSVGSYTGVYYKEYTSSHVFLANAINTSSYAPIEAATLNAALSTFTAGNAGTHVGSWGSGYSK
jgi:hypothetical protein